MPEKSIMRPLATRPKKKTWLIWLVAIILLLCLAGGGGYWWLEKKVMDTSVPRAVLTAEAALASGDLIAMGHVNIAKLVELEKLVLGMQDPEALADPGDDSLMGKAMAVGIRPSRHFTCQSPGRI